MSTMKFADSIRIIAADVQKPIFVEGAPLEYAVYAERVEKILRSVNGTRKLEEMALLLDYKVNKTNNGYLLTKNYSSEKDIPAITFEELYTFYKDLRLRCKEFSPPVWEQGPVPPTMRGKQEFFKTLTPDQWTAAKGNGLNVAELAPHQAVILSRVVSNTYIGANYIYLDQLIPTLDGVRQGVFTLDGQSLSIRWKTKFGVATSKNIVKDLSQVEASTTPYEQETTLAQLQEMTTNRSKAEQKCEYDPCLLEKPLLYASHATLSPAAMGRLFSELYGLRTEGYVNQVVIKPYRLPAHVTPGEFKDMVLKAMPKPLSRAMLQPTNPVAREGARKAPLARLVRPWRDSAISDNAQQFLVSSMAQRIRKQKGKPVPFSEASSREKAALSLWLSQEYFEWSVSHLYEVPRYISEFKNLKIKCEQYQGHKGRAMASMKLLRWDPEWKSWKTTLGWGDIWDNTKP